MSENEIATIEGDTLPALSEEAAAALRAKAEGISDRIGAPASAKRIKGDARTGKITIGDDEAETVPIVVVDFITKRVFYDTPWREGDPYRPPTCYGISTNPDTMVPHENVEEIGGEYQADACKGCPLNEWGSDGNGKACKERRVMRILQPGAEFADEEMYELDIGVTSLKSFDKMVRTISDAWGVPPIGAVIDLSMDPDSTYVKYEFTNPVPNQAIEEHFARMDEATEALAALKYDAAGEEEVPAPRRPARKKAAKKKARTRARG